jgi:hypothetical protein
MGRGGKWWGKGKGGGGGCSVALVLTQMQDHELRIGQRLVGVLLDGVELDALACAEDAVLVREAEAEFALRDPANLGVVVVDLGARDLGALGRGAEQADDVGIFDLAEL